MFEDHDGLCQLFDLQRILPEVVAYLEALRLDLVQALVLPHTGK